MTASAQSTQATVPRTQLIAQLVRQRVDALQSAALRDEPAAKATLAKLRTCDPSEVGVDPRVWQVTLAELPDELASPSSPEPTDAERVVHACLVLFAVHFQSKQEPVHRRGARLGRAVGELASRRGREGKRDNATLQRFHRLALTTEPDLRIHHLRGLIALLRTESPVIALDYGLLAADLYLLANPAIDPSPILTRWGRDLHHRPTNTTTEENQS